ncbi:sushi, von Willebrand factor type A, EGF and pentraxin domain-containing protein 1 [Nephila pilipes]|uniref:Sushi, von Willebrand factor type A, EGF and pentraxin domain-containing protein 1 n=1 Tax=Nephila pilipes TaxID=299642 RepID=A0A8X6M6G2_NEPPI|nr:sushi, von Willebrand factor type A, EGF and pentraxin domain-containing protein 1 [Nephila pilipes]
MIISSQVLLVIKTSLIVISLPIYEASRPRQRQEPCSPFPHATLENGKITSIGAQKYLFRCDPGYFLTSPQQVRCYKGNWTSLKKPHCSKIEGQCDDPPPIPGGKILGDMKFVGSVIHYMCDPGFILMGDGMRSCLQSGHWSGITPVCMDESEPVQQVAQRLKKGFVMEMGSHSTDISQDFQNGTDVIPSSSGYVDISKNSGNSLPKDQSESKDEYEFSPVDINFPPTNRRFMRKHKLRHKMKRKNIKFEPRLNAIAENTEGEKEAEAESSGEEFSGEIISLYEQENSQINISCYKAHSHKNSLTESFNSEVQERNNSSILTVIKEGFERPSRRKKSRGGAKSRKVFSRVEASGRTRSKMFVRKRKRGRMGNRSHVKARYLEARDIINSRSH